MILTQNKITHDDTRHVDFKSLKENLSSDEEIMSFIVPNCNV